MGLGLYSMARKTFNPLMQYHAEHKECLNHALSIYAEVSKYNSPWNGSMITNMWKLCNE